MNNRQDIEPVKTPEELCIESETRRDVHKALRELKSRDEKIIRLRYGIDCKSCTLEEIGNYFGITGVSVRRCQNISLEILYSKLKKTFYE